MQYSYGMHRVYVDHTSFKFMLTDVRLCHTAIFVQNQQLQQKKEYKIMLRNTA